MSERASADENNSSGYYDQYKDFDPSNPNNIQVDPISDKSDNAERNAY